MWSDEEYERGWFVRPADDARLPPSTRLRIGLTTYRGNPERFVVQLEYHHGGSWLQVVRSDHESGGAPYRDVERSGLHFDFYDADGSQIEKATYGPPVPANVAMMRAERILRRDAEKLIRRFEKWL